MNQAILETEPTQLWRHFEDLNAIPRPSKHEEQVIEFMRNFGQGLGLETIVDPVGNVVIRKPATPGMEDRVGVILQGHLDMVHQKNADTDFDFATQGIESYLDSDGWLKARGTTLGSDNGVGVASIMAVLSSTDIQHGPLEGLFTIDEETGMTGAFKLQPGILQGKILLNTDTEDEGELCIGCAGGIDSNVNLSYEPETPQAGSAFRIAIKGLRGGHSGCEIHVGRGNANKLMNRLLWSAQANGLQVASIDGGSLRNAIPRESFAEVVVQDAAGFEQHLRQFEKAVQAEYATTEPDLHIVSEPIEAPSQIMPAAVQSALLDAVYAAPCGVLRMSQDIADLVETSTSLARVLVKDGSGLVQFLTRSSVESAKEDAANTIQAAFAVTGAAVEHQGSYPGWQPNANSDILEIMKGVYLELFGKQPKVMAIHAGLECGIIGSVYPGLDMISFGPTIRNPHSPDEKCEVASVQKYWDYMLATLKSIPTAT